MGKSKYAAIAIIRETMDHSPLSGSSIFGAIATSFLFIVAKITASEVAAVFTILAAISTILLNYYKFKQSKKEQ